MIPRVLAAADTDIPSPVSCSICRRVATISSTLCFRAGTVAPLPALLRAALPLRREYSRSALRARRIAPRRAGSPKDRATASVAFVVPCPADRANVSACRDGRLRQGGHRKGASTVLSPLPGPSTCTPSSLASPGRHAGSCPAPPNGTTILVDSSGPTGLRVPGRPILTPVAGHHPCRRSGFDVRQRLVETAPTLEERPVAHELSGLADRHHGAQPPGAPEQRHEPSLGQRAVDDLDVVVPPWAPEHLEADVELIGPKYGTGVNGCAAA